MEISTLRKQKLIFNFSIFFLPSVLDLKEKSYNQNNNVLYLFSNRN